MRSPRRRLARRSRKQQFDAQPSGKGLFGIGKNNGGAHTPIDGFPAPEALEITPRAVKAGDTWFRTLAITGWPREVSAGWLQPLLSWRGAAAIAPIFSPLGQHNPDPPLPQQAA